MLRPKTLALTVVLCLASTASALAVDGLITKPSAYPANETLARLEAALKERGFVIFARLDHAAAATVVGLSMPKSTVLVFGNPRLGTPAFVKHPTPAPRRRGRSSGSWRAGRRDGSPGSPLATASAPAATGRRRS